MQASSTQVSNLDHLLGWWYRMAAPSAAPADAPLREREAVRIGKLTAATLLFEFLYITIVIGVAFTNNPHLLPVLVTNYVMILIGVVCNRFRLVRLAAIVAFSTLEGGMLYNIYSLAMVGQLNSSNLPLFDILVQPELIAVSLFPVWFVLPVAAFNCLCIVGCLAFLPKTPDLVHVLSIASYNVLERPIAIQVITALVTFLWVSTAIRGMRRADNAEELNKITQELVMQQRVKVQEKQKLESSIEQILNVHTRVASGDFSARVPLTENNVLWPLAGSLNNLLSRVQRWRQDALELERTRGIIHQLTRELQIAQQQNQPFQIHKTGTELDPFLAALAHLNTTKELRNHSLPNQ